MSDIPAHQMMPAPASSGRGEIDLLALFREIGRRKWLVILSTLLAFLLSTLAVNILKPRYTGEARVFLENRDSEYTRIGRDSPPRQAESLDQDAVQSQVQIIQSRDIAKIVVQRLALASKSEFDPLLGGLSLTSRIGAIFGATSNLTAMTPEDRVLESYMDKLKVLAVARSRVMAIEFQSRDPELAAKVAQTIAEEYIRHLENAKRGAARSAGSWLSATIEPLRQRVVDAEAKVEAYRNQNGLFLVGRDSTNSINSQQLAELNQQLATARSQQSDLSNKARLLREAIRQGRIFEISDIVRDDIVRRLLENRATLRAQIAQEEQTLLPQHPRIKELRAQMAGLEEQIRASAERTARTLENDARASAGRVAAVQADLDVQKRQSGSANEQEVQLRVLEREAKAERDQLETYLARFRDAAVRESDNSVTADARIVSTATVPSQPTFPKKLPIIIIATLSALVLSMLWAVLRALTSEDSYVTRADPAPAVGYLPHPMMMGYPHMYPQPAGVIPGVAPMAPMMQMPAAPMAEVQGSAPVTAHASMPANMAAAVAPVAAAVAATAASAQPPSPPKAEGLGDVVEYNPLSEIVAAARRRLAVERPVTLLVLSVESEAHAKATVQALNRFLGKHGVTLPAALETEMRTPVGLTAAIESLSGSIDFLIFNAGKATAGTAKLASVSDLTVLVATDDLDDPRVDAIAELIDEAESFIVSASSAQMVSGAI
jgi:polysaccharide biosynthesis transport protein